MNEVAHGLIGSVFSRVRRSLYLPGNAWVLALSATIWTTGAAMANPFQSIYFASVGADSLFIGYLLAISSAVTALMQLVGGYVADAWGRRKVIVVFSFLSASSAFVYIFIDQYYLLMFPVLLGSIGAIYSPAFSATLTDSMHPELRPRGLASFTLVTSIPSVFCPYFGGLLMRTYGSLAGLRLAYFASGLLGLAGVIYRALRLEETFSGSKSEEEVKLLSVVSNLRRDFSYVMKNTGSDVKQLLVYSVMASIGTGMSVPYTSIYVVNVLALPPDFYGLLTNMSGLMIVILLLPAARIAERVGLRKSAIFASLSIPLNQLIFVRAKGMEDLVPWSVLGGASSALLGPSMTALQADLSTPEMRGRLMALFSVSSLIVAIPAQILGGFLYSSLGPLSCFMAAIPAFILATFALTRTKEVSAKW